MNQEYSKPLTSYSPKSLYKRMPFTSLLAVIVIIVLSYTFFAGIITRFYTSALFTFYAFTNSMWISVILLGVFQTLMMIPWRIIRVRRSAHIEEFQRKIYEVKGEVSQQLALKKSMRKGEKAFLFYTVDFMVQLTTFLTIGRLFLTDFYTKKLNPDLLYSFVPYPDYPIRDTFFKLPYAWFTATKDYGLRTLLIVWGLLIAGQAVMYMAKSLLSRYKPQNLKLPPWLKWLIGGYFFFSLLISWFLIRNFPSGWELRWFTGDVSIPNPQFNRLTAVVTFLTLLYFGIAKITRKTGLAEDNHIDADVIYHTQKDMLKETLLTASFVGLGAYFITNRIPSAFELSIFTFEVISLTSPFTLDKFIMSTVEKPTAEVAQKSESSQKTQNTQDPPPS